MVYGSSIDSEHKRTLQKICGTYRAHIVMDVGGHRADRLAQVTCPLAPIVDPICEVGVVAAHLQAAPGDQGAGQRGLWSGLLISGLLQWCMVKRLAVVRNAPGIFPC